MRDKHCLRFSLAMIGGPLAAGPLAAQTASAQTVPGAGVCSYQCPINPRNAALAQGDAVQIVHQQMDFEGTSRQSR